MNSLMNAINPQVKVTGAKKTPCALFVDAEGQILIIKLIESEKLSLYYYVEKMLNKMHLH